METKTCTKCKQEREVSQFGFKSREKGLLNSHCNPCRALAAKRWAAKNKDKVRDKHREYRLENKEHINALKRTEKYKKKAAAATRRRRQKNPIPHRKEVAVWQAENIQLVRKYKSNWKRNNVEKCRDGERRQRDNLTDGYVRKLAGRFDSLVPMVRAKIQIHRATKQLLQTIKEKQDERN